MGVDRAVEERQCELGSVVDEQPRCDTHDDAGVPELLAGRERERFQVRGEHVEGLEGADRGEVVVSVQCELGAQRVEPVGQAERVRTRVEVEARADALHVVPGLLGGHGPPVIPHPSAVRGPRASPTLSPGCDGREAGWGARRAGARGGLPALLSCLRVLHHIEEPVEPVVFGPRVAVIDFKDAAVDYADYAAWYLSTTAARPQPSNRRAQPSASVTRRRDSYPAVGASLLSPEPSDYPRRIVTLSNDSP